MAIGLPFSVVVGWALGTPLTRAHVTSVTGGSGGSDAFGVAPIRTKASTGGYVARPARPANGVSAPVVVVSSTVVTKTVTVTAPAPATTATTARATASSPPPILSTPPVPTPTQISVPSEPTATPFDSLAASEDVEPDYSEMRDFRGWRRHRR